MWLQQGKKWLSTENAQALGNLQNLNQAAANGVRNFPAGSSLQRGPVGPCPSRAGTGPISAQESGCSGPVGRSPTAAPFPSGSRGPGGRLRAGSPAGGPRRRRHRGRPGLEAAARPHGKGRQRRRRSKTKRMPQIPPRPAGLRHPPPSAPSSPTSAYLGSRSGQASLPPSPGLGSRSPRGAPGLGRRVRALTMRGGTRYRAVLDVTGAGGGWRPGPAAVRLRGARPRPWRGRAGPGRHFGGAEGARGGEGKVSARPRRGAGRGWCGGWAQRRSYRG